MGGKIKLQLKKLKKLKVKTWQLTLVLIPLLFLQSTLFRFDYEKMDSIRNQVLEADENNDEETLAKTLRELSDFTRNHIILNIIEENGAYQIKFGTGVFYLENTYERAAAKAIEEAENTITDDLNPNGNIYEKAGNFCKEKAKQNGWYNYKDPAYIDCMITEINKYPSSDNLVSIYLASVPPTEIYRKEFLSPIWTLSPSGICLILCIIIIVVIFIRFLIWVIISLSLLIIEKKH